MVVVGNSGVGKTSFLRRFVDNAFDEDQNPTQGLEPEKKIVEHNGKQLKLLMWSFSADTPSLIKQW